MGNSAVASIGTLVDGCCALKEDGSYPVEYPNASSLAVGDERQYNGPRSAKDVYYKEWEPIRAALASHDVVLIRGNWLEEVYRTGGVLPRRQELPPQAVWSAEELMACVRDHRRQTPQLLSISYSWLGRDHPDPDGFHLRSFAPLLKHFARHCKLSVDTLAIFIDWCSLPQRPRSQAEETMYRRAFSAMDMWYGHWFVEVWLLTRVPDGAVPFEDRGWPKFERAVATLTSPPESTLDLGLIRPGWKNWAQVVNECQAQRRPPETPENFAADLATKAFSVREDERWVAEQYRQAFARALGSEAQLWYAGLGWSDREAQELAQLLPLCGTTLRDLELRGNDISNFGAAALADALPLCDALERLSLEGNCIGKEAQQALHDAWQRTGKPKFGLEIGEQSARPRGNRPDDTFGMRGVMRGTSSNQPTGVGSSSAASEQLNQLLARQAAFEARIESSVARLTDGLVEVADAVGARQRRAGSSGTPTPMSSPAPPMPTHGMHSPAGPGGLMGHAVGPYTPSGYSTRDHL